MERFLVDPMEEVARGVEIGEEVRVPLKTTMSRTIPVQKKTKTTMSRTIPVQKKEGKKTMSYDRCLNSGGLETDGRPMVVRMALS